MYEHQHVKKQLKELVDRITAISKRFQRRNPDNNHSDGKCEVPMKRSGSLKHSQGCPEEPLFEDPNSVANISLTEDEFFVVIGDEDVRRILTRLDIEVEGAGKEALFEIMDSGNSGTVGVASMIDTLMKLRGGTQKVDMIAPSLAL